MLVFINPTRYEAILVVSLMVSKKYKIKDQSRDQQSNDVKLVTSVDVGRVECMIPLLSIKGSFIFFFKYSMTSFQSRPADLV